MTDPKTLADMAAEAQGGEAGACPRCGCRLRAMNAKDRCNHCGKRLPLVVPEFSKGDPCPVSECEGRLTIQTTKPDYDGDGLRTRYFECDKCGTRKSCEIDAAAVSSRRVG
jgi:hypothetical protein